MNDVTELPDWQQEILRNVERHWEYRQEQEVEEAKVVALNPPPLPRAKPVDPIKNPRRSTPARRRWMAHIASGSIIATPCNVHTVDGHFVVWYIRGIGPMVTWLHHPQVRPLWVAGKAFGNNREHIVRLTAEGRRLLDTWNS